jgi:hypothetical protein
MGLFGGGNKKTLNTTNVTTRTDTNIRDIGFTGDQAVQLAGLLENANIVRESMQLDSMNSFNDWVQSTNQLSVGASSNTAANILYASAGAGSDIISQQRAAGQDILYAGEAAGQDILYASEDTGTNILDAVSNAFDGLLRGVTDFLSSASYTTEVSQEAASSAQQSAYELQRQATGAAGPALTPDQDISTISKQITIVVLGLAAVGFLWRASK